jgi:Tfp pilus assembly protein FimT
MNSLSQHVMKFRNQRGQGMTEYLIVVALIAVAAIGVYGFFGQTLRSQTAGIALELSGQSASEAINQAKSSATQAQSTASQRRGLEDYGSGNR